VFTRRDGTTEVAHVGSPFLAVLFEDTFKRAPESAADNGWLAFYDAHERAPESHGELMEWLRQFVGSELADFAPEDPTATAPSNGAEPPISSPS